MERFKSPVWKHFKLNTPTSPMATCSFCNRDISRGGSNIAKYNTTNLNRHLQTCHAKELKAGRHKIKQENTPKPVTMVETRLQRPDKLPADSVKATNITEKVLEFIVLGSQPLSVVDNEAFRRLVECLEPRYCLPSRDYFSDMILPELYKKVSKHVSEELKDVTWVSFTTYIWSCDVCPITLLGLTVHWLDTSCSPHSAMLRAKNFRGQHTGDAMSAAIREMLDQWHIPLNKVHVILGDNACNMGKAMKNMGVRSLGCFAHTLHIVVSEGLLSQPSVSDVVASCRQIVGHFKHSPLAYSRLHDIQLQMQMQQKRLQQDVETRWISTYYMIESLLEQREALCAYVADHDLPTTLTVSQWALLEKTMAVLAPFEELTRKISSPTASTSDVIPAVTVLKRILAKESQADPGVKAMKTTLLQAVNIHFNTVEDEPLYALATLLDPRYKDRYFTSAGSAKHAKDILTRELQEDEWRSGRARTRDASEPAKKALRLEAAPPPPSKSSFMDEFDQILEECEELGPASSSRTSVQVHEFFTERTIAASDSPYQYWGVNRHRFPDLATTAVKYLCAPCASVESEGLFSIASNIVDEKRNRLTPERAEMLVFMRKNLPLLLKFPLSKPQLASKWVHSLGMKNFIPTANTCLCSEHFRTDCFRDYNGKQFLREDAVPTIFTQPQDTPKIELRKRGVIPKETNVANQMGTAADRVREAVSLRREKRGGMRGGRGGRGGKQLADRQNIGAKSRVYDNKGRLLSNGNDMCDCLDVDCMGCFYPCPECGSRKCGVECRCDRKWLYEQVEVEGGEIIRNKFAI